MTTFYFLVIVCVLLLQSINEIKSYDEIIILNENATIHDFDQNSGTKVFRVKMGQIPYLASVQDKFFQHFCGATIISKTILLSAAHCFSKNIKTTYYVRAGFVTFRSTAGQITLIDTVLCYPKFNQNTLLHDVALLKTRDVLQFGTNIGPIIYARARPDLKDECIASGWGSVTPTRDKFPETLHAVTMTIKSTEDCKYTGYSHETMLCVGGNAGHGTCAGDSGGPLVCGFELSGIISYSTISCASGEPDVMTDVSYYHDYIEENIRKMENTRSKQKQQRNSLASHLITMIITIRHFY